MLFRDGEIRTVGEFSPHIKTTDEGYLLCKDVPISRVGRFEYSGLEAGLPSKNGKVLMSRTPEELFSEDTIKSFELKPVVIGHSRFADPDNWKQIAVGVVKNVRRGQGDQNDQLLADLLITDRNGIRLVKSGDLREVSCGYDADTISDGEGYGHQVGIVGNHVALVKKARCGEKCKIRDSQMTTNLKTMLRRLFRDGDEDKFNEALEKVDVQEIKDQDPADPTPAPADLPKVKTTEERLAEIEVAIANIQKLLAESKPSPAPAADSDPAATPPDPAPAPVEEIVPDDEAKQTLADAETLCPGMKRPTGDAKDGKFSREVIERTMRSALKGAGVTMFGDSAEMDGPVLKTAFKAAVEMARRENNPKAKPFGDSARDKDDHKKSAQELMNDFWNK
ncbi:MAG TPA: DUF2213 domain-containing protein [Candidatus Aphodousia gallistercoris]|nr:DUF2213 domain-containing protein [Candidatus Aphodousia gallistercoris]